MAIKARIEIQGGDTLAIESLCTGDCAFIPCGGVDGQRMLAELVRVFTTDVAEGSGEPMHRA